MAVDPKGYYAILGLAASASATEIKRAFRRRAIELHPDRNKASHAIEMFLLLKEAYETLSDTSRRASYDIWATADDPDEEDSPQKGSKTDPILCSVCEKVTAQPRYVIYMRVKSYIVGSSRTTSQGIFCSECAAKKAIRATLTTWLFGWWCLPLGPIYAAHAIVRNTFGGIKPKDINARIAAHQAWHFASVGQPALARAVAAEALKLASGTSRHSADLTATVLRVLEVIPTEGPPRRLRNPWRLLRRPFFVQAIPLFVIVAIGANAVVSITRPAPAAVVRPVPTVEPVKPSPPPPSVEAMNAPRRTRYIRPPVADNGVPWPTISGYVPGYPRKLTSGQSTLTVDNSQNDSDVFAKLFSLGEKSRVLARAFFIPGGSKFTIESLERGRYDLRYRNLSSGVFVKSEPFELKEISASDSIKVTTLTVTLYKVAGGGLRIDAISAEEFE